MARVTPEQFQQKHAANLKAAIPYMQQGIQSVTIAPTSQAADKIQKLKANLNAAIDSGKMAKRMRAVTLDQWKGAMLNKGVNRVATGIDAAAADVTAFASQLLPYVDSQVAIIDKMPDATLEDSLNRVTTFIRGMAKFQRT